MKAKTRFLALILAALMASATLASCAKGQTPPSVTEGENETVRSTEKETEGETADSTESHGSETTRDTEKESESENETEQDIPPVTPENLLTGDYASSIENANRLANTVNSYYRDSSRSAFVMENGNAIWEFDMHADGNKQLSYLKNKSGATYIENTMDVFLRMSDGSTFFASESVDNGLANIYRLGYYYYENRIDGLSFVSQRSITAEEPIKHLATKHYNDVEELSRSDGILVLRVTDNEDPRFALDKVKFSAEKYNALALTIKANDQFSGLCTLYINAGEYANSTSFGPQSTSFNIIPDNEYHTYIIPLENIVGYSGDVTGLRFDIDPNRGGIDATMEIKELKAVKVDSGDAPLYPRVCRIFGAYSDKLHHTVQVSTYQDLEGVKEIGTVTNISADTVNKLIVMDKNGLHNTLDGIDWASAEYIGFDIKCAGIFGIILPFDGKGGSMEVTLAEGVYSIIQTMAVKDGKLVAPQKGEKNANDLYMGCRIYTDSRHVFDDFLKAAEEERNPLTNRNIIINSEKSTAGEFLGYDSLRGIYHLTIDGVYGFNPHYLLHNNRQFNVTFTLRGEKESRNIYVMARLEDGGSLECAALLDGNQMLIPVPLEVGKNFSDGGGGIHDIDDARFCETILPLTLEAGKKTEYSIVNMYHKWGAYLLKQISFITYFAPYYHMSTGIHESNCLIPYYFTKNGNSLNMLPDHRAMSSPVWDTDPQHTYCGNHYFLQYTDADGNYSASENIRDLVGSYGPIYADITMDFISYDGKIKASYNHMEMPQTDENRAYYEMSYEILEDISFKDFAHDFSFYSVTANDPAGMYTKVGYLNESNESAVAIAAKRGESFKYTLGDNCPYFSFFDMENCADSRGYSNLSFIIGDYEIIISGEKSDAHFSVVNTYGYVSLSLDLGEVTLKAGDTIKINAIILPWGSQISDYSGDAPDKNVRDVRLDSFIDPYRVEAIGDSCSVMDTAFLPAVKSNDGKSATFKISGGRNNAAVRVYGFDMLTVPVIEELIDGEWKEVKLSSIHTPDAMDYGYQYDGYMVYYDGDGTFSYAFVSEMKGDERTFRITADKEFEGWPEITVEEGEKFFFDGEKLEAKSRSNKKFLSVEVLEENGKKFARFKGASSEAYLSLFADNEDVSGKYLVIKYRIPSDNSKKILSWNFFTSTVNNEASSSDSLWASGLVVSDGQWQVMAIDISGLAKAGFDPNSDGDYVARYLRFDIFNEAFDEGTQIDFEYIAMYTSLEDIIAKNKDMKEIMHVTKSTEYNYVSTDDSATLNVKLSATQLYAIGNAASYRFNSVTLAEDKSYVTFAGCTGAEATLLFLNENSTPTGSYVVLKYRMKADNPDKIGFWNFFTSTVNKGATGSDSFSSSNTVYADGEWHVIVFDLAAYANESFAPDDNGVYTAKYFRFDVFNSQMNAETSYDIAYFGMCDDLERIKAVCAEDGELTLVTGGEAHELIKLEKTSE